MFGSSIMLSIHTYNLYKSYAQGIIFYLIITFTTLTLYVYNVCKSPGYITENQSVSLK